MLLSLLLIASVSAISHDPRYGPAPIIGTRRVVAAHMNEDLKWLANLCDVAPVTVMSYTLMSQQRLSMKIIHEPDRPGKEVAAYLKYILDNYHALPDQIAFIHAHHESWHTFKQDILLRQADWNGHGYRPITPNQFRWTLRTPPNNATHNVIMSRIWQLIFQLYLGDEHQDEVAYYCCGSFIVDRATIQRHPRSTYNVWYLWVIEPRFTDKHYIGYAFEYTWHRIFGRRHDNPDADDPTPLRYPS